MPPPPARRALLQAAGSNETVRIVTFIASNNASDTQTVMNSAVRDGSISALLTRLGLNLLPESLVVSGVRSHPQCRAYQTPQLAALRWAQSHRSDADWSVDHARVGQHLGRNTCLVPELHISVKSMCNAAS